MTLRDDDHHRLIPSARLVCETYFPRIMRLLLPHRATPDPAIAVGDDESHLAMTDTLVITRSAMDQIKLTIGVQPAESGGILVADQDGIVRLFVYDSGAETNSVAYTPGIEGLIGVISGLKKFRNYSLCGIVHSHPKRFTILSDADVDMANLFFEINPSLKKLYLPIVQTESDTHNFNMYAYVFHRPLNGEWATPVHVEIQEIEDASRQ